MKTSDNWRTPDWLYKQLEEEHGPFDIDLCATAANSKCNIWMNDYFTSHIDNQGFHWHDNSKGYYGFKAETAFINPPYSNPLPFIEKAWEDSKHCKIVALVPVNTTAPWWAVFWNHYSVNNAIHPLYQKAGPKPGCSVQFLPKRVQFNPPIELVERGEVRKIGNKWTRWCDICGRTGNMDYHTADCGWIDCFECKGKGFTLLPGPSFATAILIFDRRGI